MCFMYIKRNFVAKHGNDLSVFFTLLTIFMYLASVLLVLVALLL